LDHLADGALRDQIAGMDRGTDLEPLGIHDRKLPPRLLHRAADVGKLLEAGDRRLVAEKILARTHRPDAERRTQIRNRRADDQLDRLVAEDLVLTARELDAVAVPLLESLDMLGISGEEGDRSAAAADHRVGHAIDVRMVQPDHAELDAVFRGRLGPGGRRIGGDGIPLGL